MKLRYKLVVIPMIIAVIVFCTIIAFSIINYRGALLRALNGNQILLVTNMSQTVDEYISKYKDTVTYLETMDRIKDTSEYNNIQVAYKGLSDQQGVEVRQLFKNALDIYPHFAYLETFTKEQGQNVVLEPYEAQLNVLEEDYLRGFAFRDWYKGAIDTGTTYISEAYLSASIMEPVIAISTPIKNQEEIVGILIGTLRLEELSTKMKALNYGETGHSYIIDKNNHIVAHPDDRYFEHSSLYRISDNEIVESIKKTQGKIDGTIQLYDNLTDDEVYVYYKKSSVTDWYIVSQISVKEVKGPVWQGVKTILLFTSFFVCGFLLFLYINANGIIKPLFFLSNIAINVSRNELDLTENDKATIASFEKKKSEVGILVTTFGVMVERLNSSFKKLKQRNDEIDFLANHDPLTQLPNRRRFRVVLEGFLKQGADGIVVLMDLDNFKLINDTLGHIFGDRVLVQIASNLNKMITEDVFISRFGGDEFIMCVNNISSEEAVTNLIKEIVCAFSNITHIDDIPLDIKSSIGIARFPEDSKDMSQLIRFADLALYRAKNNGKNCSEFFRKDMEENILHKADVERELNAAFSGKGFRLVYQPQVELQSGEVKAYEALIRMNRDLYSPGEFIAIAEETGQIIKIGRWVLEAAIIQQRKWMNEGVDIKVVSVNFSAAQLQDKGYIEFLKALLEKYNIEPKWIELEITENVFIEKLSVTSIFLKKIDELGVKISIDDFGTGYSSLNYLISLPISKIKLDRTLSEKFLKPDSLETITSLISLSHSLELVVVAEGIEHREDVLTLVESGCDMVQGYYFSKPLEVEDMEDYFGVKYEDILKESTINCN